MYDFYWHELYFDREWCRPKEGQLVVLRVKRKKFGSVYYEIGCFKVPKGRRKLWWYQDQKYPIDQKRLYRKDDRTAGEVEIHWCPLP